MYSEIQKKQRYEWINANKDYLSQYRIERKERIAEYNKCWSVINKEKRSEYNKKRYYANKQPKVHKTMCKKEVVPIIDVLNKKTCNVGGVKIKCSFGF